MCDSKERSDIQTKVQTDELFTKLSDGRVPLSKADMHKAMTALAALEGENSGSSSESADRK
jgi:hypothetical protein